MTETEVPDTDAPAEQLALWAPGADIRKRVLVDCSVRQQRYVTSVDSLGNRKSNAVLAANV